MSWNDNLYLYGRDHGGTYYGLEDDAWNGTLLLEYRGLPMLVRCDVESSGRALLHTARAIAVAELERPYRLTISNKDALHQRINTLLGGLEQGAQRLKVKVDLHRDYGAPQVTQGRAIRTSDPEFTKSVFRDLELRTALLNQPEYELAVGPCGPGERRHQVEARVRLDAMFCSWDVGLENERPEEAGRREAQYSPEFEQRLEQLMELARAARGAVTAWRM